MSGMSGTLVSLLDSIQARQTCPACEGKRLVADMPTQWHQHRAMFECGAVFIARGEAIEVERACADRSKLCAQLWTVSAKGNSFEVAVLHKLQHDEALANDTISQLILALAMAATTAGFDPLTICEIIRDEMQLAAARGKA